jgi:hypothetical protein
MGREVSDYGTEGSSAEEADAEAAPKLAPAEEDQHPALPEEVDVRVCPSCGKS